MPFIKITAIGSASFAIFSLVAQLIPGGWGRLGCLVILALCALPFFTNGSEDAPNDLGGLGVWVGAVAIACLALMLLG